MTPHTKTCRIWNKRTRLIVGLIVYKGFQNQVGPRKKHTGSWGLYSPDPPSPSLRLFPLTHLPRPRGCIPMIPLSHFVGGGGPYRLHFVKQFKYRYRQTSVEFCRGCPRAGNKTKMHFLFLLHASHRSHSIV